MVNNHRELAKMSDLERLAERLEKRLEEAATRLQATMDHASKIFDEKYGLFDSRITKLEKANDE